MTSAHSRGIHNCKNKAQRLKRLRQRETGHNQNSHSTTAKYCTNLPNSLTAISHLSEKATSDVTCMKKLYNTHIHMYETMISQTTT